MNVLLYGVKGSGKTTLGQRVAGELQWTFVDTDHLLAQHYNQQHNTQLTHREIFNLIGERTFRQWEKDTITGLNPSNNTIISVGGSSLLEPSSQQHCRAIASCVYCHISLTTFLSRLNQPTEKPSYLKNTTMATDYFEQRDPIYTSLADHVFDNDGCDINSAAQQLAQWVRGQ